MQSAFRTLAFLVLFAPVCLAGSLDGWTGRIANFSPRPGALVLQLQRGLGCRSFPVGTGAAEIDRLADTIVVPDHESLSLRSGGRKPVYEKRATEVWSNTLMVCRSEVHTAEFLASVKPGAGATVTFKTRRGSEWHPMSIGWLDESGVLHLSQGSIDCRSGRESSSERGLDVKARKSTPYAVQAMGYLFRGHAIDLPVNHIDDPRAGWRAQGEGVVGAFVKNARLGRARFHYPAIFRAEQTVSALGGKVEVTGLHWNLDWTVVDGILRATTEELVDDRERLFWFQMHPTIKLAYSDQHVAPGESELYLVYDRSLPEERRPIFFHVRDGRVPPLPAAPAPPKGWLKRQRGTLA